MPQMRRDQKVAGVGKAVEQFQPGIDSHCRVAAKAARPLRLIDLYRAMNGIGAKKRLLCAMAQAEAELTRCVTRQCRQRYSTADVKPVFNKVCETCFDDRQDAVAETAVIVHPGRCQFLSLPMVKLGPTDQIARVRESWHPAAVNQLCVPSDVIGVQMGAHHDIDVLGPEPGSCQSFKIAGRGTLVPIRTFRPRFVFTDAGINQDRASVDAKQMAVHAEQNFTSIKVHMVGCKRCPMRFERLYRATGKQEVYRQCEAFEIRYR